MTGPVGYRPRRADPRLAELLGTFPAVLVTGPRAAGKTTTAARQAAEVVRLDQPAQAEVFRADPDAALRTRAEPVLLDEWQEVPEVLGAVKRAVDADSRLGRFVLTGSVRAPLQQQMWPGTGRLLHLTMHGLTEAEVNGLDVDRAGFLDRLLSADPAAFALPRERPALPDYVALALRGGFPEPVYRIASNTQRRVWFESYLDQLMTRDAAMLAPRRDPQKMRRYFEVLALNTAGLPAEATLCDAAGINIKTAESYDQLFSDLFVADRIPAWSRSRLARLVRRPKRYIVDTALAATAAGLTVRAVLDEADLLGRVFDSFATAQLRVEVALSHGIRRLHHLRTEQGRREVDLVVEIEDGRVLAIEFKASAAPSRADARHMQWLRDELGDRFVAGAVVHSGPDVFVLDDRIMAVPLCAMWG